MPAGEGEFRPRWRTCSNCRKVRFLEPYVVVNGKRQPLYMTSCSQCRRRTKRWIDDFVSMKQAELPAEVPARVEAPDESSIDEPKDM